MRILQTLGKHRQIDDGVFGYQRTVDGVEITLFRQNASTFLVTREEWQGILQAINGSSLGTFRLELHPDSSTDPPRQAMYDVLSASVPDPRRGWTWDNSKKAASCAILEHEGSLDLYGGPLGSENSAIICLSKDCG
jgi:hypothetical protein